MKKINVLFVCMGNICRSPTAEGVFTQLINNAGLRSQIGVDSAGTISFHAGSPPDSRAQKAAIERGYDISHQRSRQITPEDCHEFDYILVMDDDNMEDVRQLCPQDCKARMSLFLDYVPGSEGMSIPDPYSGSRDAFEHAISLVEQASAGLLEQIIRDSASEDG